MTFCVSVRTLLHGTGLRGEQTYKTTSSIQVVASCGLRKNTNYLAPNLAYVQINIGVLRLCATEVRSATLLSSTKTLGLILRTATLS